ncbi:MAG: hypothetical protein L7U72_15935 [Rubripirellula sp.]|nr:hypothetical protein [Rubripirellula sp.]
MADQPSESFPAGIGLPWNWLGVIPALQVHSWRYSFANIEYPNHNKMTLTINSHVF